MTSVTVFVDNAVRGELPAICARTGRPTDTAMVVRTPVGGLGAAAWLLVLLGPPGWLALLVISVAGWGREEIAVRLPYSEQAIAEERPWQRLRMNAGFAGAVAIVLAIPHPLWSPLTWLLLGAITLLVAFVAHSVLYFRAVDVKLDGSRRWVTLAHVHPRFAEAVLTTLDASRRMPGRTGGV